MEITRLLERIVAQNETIIKQHIELLLAVSALLDEHSKGTKANGVCEVAALPSPR